MGSSTRLTEKCVWGGGSSGLVGIQVDLLIDEEDEKRPADTHH